MVEVPSSGGGGRWRKIRKYKVEDRGHLLLSGMKAKTGAPSSLSTTTLAGGPGADAGLVEAAQRWSRISRTRLSCNEGSFLPLRMRMFSKRDQNACQSLLLISFRRARKTKIQAPVEAHSPRHAIKNIHFLLYPVPLQGLFQCFVSCLFCVETWLEDAMCRGNIGVVVSF